VGFPINGYLAFLHRLQQSGLGFRRSAIDFVCEKERSEDWAADEGELVALKVEDICAGDVGGHEVGRELDTGKVTAEHVGESTHQQRFGHAGNSLDKCVLTREDDDQGLLYHVVLADDHLSHLGAGRRQDFR
jgi:hypothetical protein